MADLATQVGQMRNHTSNASGVSVPYVPPHATPPPTAHRPTAPPPVPPRTLGGTTNGVPNSAEDIVKQFLAKYGLGSLATWAWNIYTSTGGGTTGMDAITAELPNTKEFKARFPAYDELAKEGRAMSPAEMLNYEQTARQLFHAAGLPGGFYDTPAELAKFMIGNVSTTELQARVQDAQKAMIDSPQDVRDQLQRLYGIDHGHMTAFFLDPTQAEPLIAQKFTSAQIAAEAERTKFGQISGDQAMGLAQLGVTDQAAQQGFNKLGMEQGLFQQQVAGESAIGQQTQLNAQFGGDVNAQQAFLTRAAQRTASFREDTGFRAGQKGVGGLGASDTSTPT